MGSVHEDLLTVVWWLSGEKLLSSCFELLAKLVIYFFFMEHLFFFIWKNDLFERIKIFTWKFPDT